MKMFKNCLTVQEIFSQHRGSHQGLVYKRIPLLDCSAPREEVMTLRDTARFSPRDTFFWETLTLDFVKTLAAF